MTKSVMALGVAAALAAFGPMVSVEGQVPAAGSALNRANGRPTPPYVSIRSTEASLAGQTLYRPADLSALGNQKMPIVAYGNGGCIANGGAGAEALLLEWAANGYLVGAGGTFRDPQAGRGAAPAAPPARSGEPPALDRPAAGQTATAVLTEFIDWAIRENGRADSPYRNRIDTTTIALTGHSCGGLQAMALADDPRISTLVILNSGTIPSAGIPLPGGGFRRPMGYVPSNERDLTEFHTPVLYLIGGPTDQAHGGAQADFVAISGVPLFMGNYGVGHGGTYQQPRGGLFAEIATDWLDWQLKGVSRHAARFAGADCGLCAATGWTVQRKNLDRAQ